MKCGDLGHVGVDGRPCAQIIGAKAKACIWHSMDAEGRKRLALKGGMASRVKSIVCLRAEATMPPVLDNPPGCGR